MQQKQYKSSHRSQKPRDIADLGENLGRLPAQAPDLEEAVLGALLFEKSGHVALDILQPEDFYIPANKEIFSCALELYKENKAIDMRTVVNALRKSGKLEIVGGPHYVAELTARVVSTIHIEQHCRIIQEMAIKRNVAVIASRTLNDCYQDTTDAFEIVSEFHQDIDKIGRAFLSGNIKKGKDLVAKQIIDVAKGQEISGITGVPSGFTDLDKITSGWQKSDLVIVAARPAMGKTAFIVCCLRNAAVDYKKPVAIFSLEMPDTQIINRMLSAETEIFFDKIKNKSLEEYDITRLMHKTNALTQAPFFIDDSASLTIIELRAKCRRLKIEHDIQLIIVDYLQLLKGDDRNNREQEIASISRALKGIAKELSVPVIALSQLSRSVEQRGGDKRPMLSDLRESGSIEQDADIVMFLYRPEYYGITTDADGFDLTGVAEVIIAKHRNGNTGTVNLKFLGQFQKFMNLTELPPKVDYKEQKVAEARKPFKDSDDDETPF